MRVIIQIQLRKQPSTLTILLMVTDDTPNADDTLNSYDTLQGYDTLNCKDTLNN